MKRTAAWLIVMSIGLTGCRREATPSANEALASSSTEVVVDWFRMPPVERVSHRDTLIPILTIDGTRYTVCRGVEVPLKESPEGLEWAAMPSSMAGTTIGLLGGSEPYYIRIVDRQRENFDESWVSGQKQPLTKTDKPSGLLDATAPQPQSLDDFVGLYQPVWFPWARMETRKDGQRYLAVDQQLDPPEPPGEWKARSEPHELTPLSDRLGFETGSQANPKAFTYNETLKRFEIVLTNSGARIPLAKVSASPGKDATLPPLPIGIPAWH